MTWVDEYGVEMPAVEKPVPTKSPEPPPPVAPIPRTAFSIKESATGAPLNRHRVLYECLLEANGDVEAAFAAAEYIMSADARGRNKPTETPPLAPTPKTCSTPLSVDESKTPPPKLHNDGWVAVPDDFLRDTPLCREWAELSLERSATQPVVIHNHVAAPSITVPASPAPNVQIDAPITFPPQAAPEVHVGAPVVNVAAPTQPDLTELERIAAPVVLPPPPEDPEEIYQQARRLAEEWVDAHR